MEKRPHTRETLARNILWLMEQRQWKQPDLAKASGVAQASISNMLDPEGPQPTLKSVSLVAQAFGLDGWQLIHPRLPELYPYRKDFDELLEDYELTDEEGRQTIRRVAESLSEYHKNHPDPPQL